MNCFYQIFTDDEENELSEDSSLRLILHSRGILWRFQLLAEPEVVVYSATKANEYNVGHLYQTFHP